MSRIIVDCCGGDTPINMVEGAVLALGMASDLKITLVGKQEEIKSQLAQFYKGNDIEIVDARQVVTNDDAPTVAIREKIDSSMVVALKLLAEGDKYDGAVSSGSTGALLTGAFMIVKRIRGISRPAICPIVPNLATGGKSILIDGGANADCKPINLAHFAIMGSAYAKEVFGINSPKVGLLSNGSEDAKGNEFTKETFPILKGMKNINFVGNIEAKDALAGKCDVLVTDGFTGNVALKSYEGMANCVFSVLKTNIQNNGFLAKIGYLLLKKSLRNVKNTLDSSEQGGAIFLGVEKPVVKTHGSSKSHTVALAIMQAKNMADGEVVKKIKKALSETDLKIED